MNEQSWFWIEIAQWAAIVGLTFVNSVQFRMIELLRREVNGDD